MRRLYASWILWALCTAGWAQSPPALAIDLKDPQAAKALQKDLASDDFPTRDRAQRIVDALGQPYRDDLAHLADATADQEAQSRLRTARVDQLDDQRALSPPPLSLSLKDATMDDVAAAFTKITGQDFTAASGGAAAADRFSLDATNVPFWEIYRRLNDQHPLWFSMSVNAIQLYHNSTTWHNTIVGTGTAVMLQPLTPPPAARAGAAATALRYTSTIGLGIDPRIRILQVKAPEFALAIDNAQARWTITPTSTTAATISTGRGVAFSRAMSLEPATAVIGKTLPTIRGTFPIVVQSEQASRTLDPAKDAQNARFTLGRAEITLTKFTATRSASDARNANIAFDFIIHEAMVKIDPDGPPLLGTLGPLSVTIVDATGKTIATRTLARGFFGSMSNSLNVPATLPVTVRLEITTATREIKIPFEFKDVPIP